MNFAKHELFIVQPTTLCNLDCRYCWLPDRHLNKKMSHETFSNFLHRVGNAAPDLAARAEMVWHGGEPLTLGVGYYRQCLEDLRNISRNRGYQLPVGIQTNAVLLNSEWIQLFKEYDVQIGVSVDGPDWVHDQKRPYRNGRASHSDVQRGMDLLYESGIQFSVIAVLTANSICYPDEMFDYFCTVPTKKGFAFNIDENDGANISSSIICSGKEQDVRAKIRAFFYRLLNLNEAHGRILDIRDFDKYIDFIDRGRRPGGTTYNSMVTPGALINVDYAGNTSTFCPELLMGHNGPDNPFVFGNVNTDDFHQMSKSEKFLHISDEVSMSRAMCRTKCDYFEVCGGGAPSNRYAEHGSFGGMETQFCKYQIQSVADAVVDFVESKAQA